jgi:hypothetical protein
MTQYGRSEIVMALPVGQLLSKLANRQEEAA